MVLSDKEPPQPGLAMHHHAGQKRVNTREIDDLWLKVDDAGRFRCEEMLGASQSAMPVDPKLYDLAGAFLDESRRYVPPELNYLILVPTLRCNLACSYCQVSRAAENASGFDWSAETLADVQSLLTNLSAASVKIEFQGGEPTLRPDLLKAVIDAVPDSTDATFVICTNLQQLSDQALELLDRDDVSVSTSLDGSLAVHATQRGSIDSASRFFENLRYIIDRYGATKVSALPTIDPFNLPKPADLVDAFSSFGLRSIYLRPINYQGFARKQHRATREVGDSWSAYHREFIEFLIARNWEQEEAFEETYFTTLLERIFRPGSTRHVDFRNPNPVGRDYVVVDYDGKAYPTDEARMLTRSGVIDLSIGTARDGWDTPERAALERVATLDGDPDCEACAYKSYCGRDIVDDLSRYGTIDTRRHETEFCRRHMALFDLAFELIHTDDERVRYSLGKWLRLPGLMPRIKVSV